jgi:hypothetical protein
MFMEVPFRRSMAAGDAGEAMRRPRPRSKPSSRVGQHLFDALRVNGLHLVLTDLVSAVPQWERAVQHGPTFPASASSARIAYGFTCGLVNR